MVPLGSHAGGQHESRSIMFLFSPVLPNYSAERAAALRIQNCFSTGSARNRAPGGVHVRAEIRFLFNHVP